MSKSTMGLVLPSNSPTDFFEMMLPSLLNLAPIKSRVTILANLQEPWTKELAIEAKKACHSHGIKFQYIFSAISRPPKMCELRNNAAGIDKEVTYYCFCDDNTVFMEGTRMYPRNSGERYEDVMDYMDKFPTCGVVQCDGSLGGDVMKADIAPSTNGLVSTRNGLFFRNVEPRTNLFPVESLSLLGGFEEIVCSYEFLRNGYFFAKQFNNPTHNRSHVEMGEEEDPDGMLSRTVIEANAQKWVRDRWEAKTWVHDDFKFPANLWKEFHRSTEVEGVYWESCQGCKHKVRSTKFRMSFPVGPPAKGCCSVCFRRV